MNTLWTVVTIAAVVAIVGVVLWALVVAPFTVPSHSAKP
jgi:cytochrome b subunit of formate dehydrogenase